MKSGRFGFGFFILFSAWDFASACINAPAVSRPVHPANFTMVKSGFNAR
jgi:hypothetical protein